MNSTVTDTWYEGLRMFIVVGGIMMQMNIWCRRWHCTLAYIILCCPGNSTDSILYGLTVCTSTKVCGLSYFPVVVGSQFQTTVVIYTSVWIVSRTLIVDWIISLSCGVTSPYIALCVLSEIHTGLWAPSLSCSSEVAILDNCHE